MHTLAAATMALGIGILLGILCYVAAAVIVGLACAAYFFGVAAIFKRKNVDPRRKEKIMTDEQIKAINEVAGEMYANACDKGFHDQDTDPLAIGRIAEFIANLHEETSELWSAARKGELYKQCDKPVPLTCAAEELADIVIRAMDTSVGMGIDLGTAIATKHRYNQTRIRMHGKLA
jgi:NTP pyrophosphatase (non-canonical NTP hydrolase)